MKPITGPVLCRLLERNGWEKQRIKGSHHIYSKPGQTKVLSVPLHGNQTLKPGLANRLAKDADITW